MPGRVASNCNNNTLIYFNIIIIKADCSSKVANKTKNNLKFLIVVNILFLLVFIDIFKNKITGYATIAKNLNQSELNRNKTTRETQRAQ